MTDRGEQVVTLTMNPSLDKSTETERVDPDRKLRCGPITREPGGGGINVSRVVHRLGHPTVAVYPSGGSMGEDLNRLMAEESAHTRTVPVGPSIRESLMVMETASRAQYRFSFPGPTLDDSEVKACLDVVCELAADRRVVVLSGSLPPGVPAGLYREIAEALSSDDCMIVVDTSGQPLKEAVEGPVFLIKPNLGEFEELMEASLPNDEAIADAARDLVRRTALEHLVVSLGAGGAVVVSGERFERISSPTVPIRSRVGAGDSAVGGIAYGLARGMTVGRSARVGVAAGAATVMSPGTSLCQRSDVDRLFQGMTGEPLPGGRERER